MKASSPIDVMQAAAEISHSFLLSSPILSR